MLHLLSEATPLSLPFICELRWVTSLISIVLCVCIHYMIHSTYNYRSDITLIPLRNGNICKKSNCAQQNLGKLNSDFSKYPLIRNKFRNTLESENIGPVYELFKICFVCVKETSPRDVSFMHTLYLLDRENTDNNHF